MVSVTRSTAPTTSRRPAISVISWVNDLDLYEGTLKYSITGMVPPRLEPPNVEFIAVLPEDRALNMGAAYNLGQAYAKHDIKLYAHQDLLMMEPLWDVKIAVALSYNDLERDGKRIGAVGFHGSTSIAPPYWMFAPPDTWVGIRLNWSHGEFASARSSPEFARALWVDGVGFATDQTIDWAECYQKQHFVVEDACMALQEAGFEIWTVPINMRHLELIADFGPDFWCSAALFRERWKDALPVEVVDLESWRKALSDPEAQEIRTGRGALLAERRARWLAEVENDRAATANVIHAR